MDNAPINAEARRQQQLLHTLRTVVPAAGLREGVALARGLQAYQAHAGELAERALRAVYPTVQQVVGDEAFATLARAHWHAHAPTSGDMGRWGADLADFLAHELPLKEEPYLPDLARLEWAVHVAERASDDSGEAVMGLALLAEHDPDRLFLRLAAGCALVSSTFPVMRIWSAHRSQAPDRFASARTALAAGEGDVALVFRQGWRVHVQAVPPGEARFTGALLQAQSLGQALTLAGADFAFEPWLITAIQQRRLWSVTLDGPMQESVACSTAPPPLS